MPYIDTLDCDLPSAVVNRARFWHELSEYQIKIGGNRAPWSEISVLEIVIIFTFTSRLATSLITFFYILQLPYLKKNTPGVFSIEIRSYINFSWPLWLSFALWSIRVPKCVKSILIDDNIFTHLLGRKLSLASPTGWFAFCRCQPSQILTWTFRISNKNWG